MGIRSHLTHATPPEVIALNPYSKPECVGCNIQLDQRA